MIRKSGNRFSEKIMLKQKDNARVWFNCSWNRHWRAPAIAFRPTSLCRGGWA